MPDGLLEGAPGSMGGSSVPIGLHGSATKVDGLSVLPRLGSRRRAVVVGLALLLAIAMPMVQFRMIVWKLPWSKSDIIPISEGVRAILRHEDPYSATVTRRIQTMYWGHPLSGSEKEDEQHFAYPAYAALVLAPLGRLSWQQGRLLFLLVVPVLTALSVPMWLDVLGLRARAGRVALWTVLALASWPIMWGLRLCQVTLPIAFFVVAGCWLLRRGHDAAAGLVFSLAIVKPQSTGPLLAYLFVWALFERRWSFPLAVTAGCGALVAWARWMVPGWAPHWLSTMREYARYTQLGLIPQLLFGRWLGALMVIALAAGGAVALWRLRAASVASSSREFALSIALVLALTLAIMPTSGGMNYNDVFLLPGVLLVLNARPSSDGAGRARRLVLLMLGLSYASVPLAVLLEAARGNSPGLFALPVYPVILLPAATALWIILNGLQGASRQRLGIAA